MKEKWINLFGFAEQIDVANTELAEKQLAYILDTVPIAHQESAEYPDDDDDNTF
jgi:hypothetical protein